tara:strand:+ start:30 stop:275 length:246 start_codon:yes stop_codon:yes gene_type:complete
MERFTITRTRRYGNSDTQISNVFTGMRNNTKKDDVIKMANDMVSREKLITNEEVEYEVILAYDTGVSKFIHRVEKKGKRSI